MTTFLLDTDIGTDVDDALALSFLLDKKKRTLLGIIVTNGPTKIRAEVAGTILSLTDASHIPVFRGQSQSKTQGCIPFVTGKEGIGLAAQPHAFSLKTIIPILLSQPDRSIVYILIAPASSCSTLLDIPQVRKKIKSIVCMGGVIGGDPSLPIAEHNIAADPTAFARICSLQVPIKIVPLNITLRQSFSNDAIAKIAESHTPLADHMSKWIQEWKSFTQSFGVADHWFRNRILLHDPLTCLAAIRKSSFTWKSMKIAISRNGVLQEGKGSSVHVALAMKKQTVQTLTSEIVSGIVTRINMV